MTEKEARALATRIAKSSTGVRVKFGRTNGEHVLHLLIDRQSETIASAVEWDEHPANLANRRAAERASKAAEAREVREAIKSLPGRAAALLRAADAVQGV